MILAIDVGANGAFAAHNGKEIEIYKIPETPRAILELLKDINPEKVYIEKVGTHQLGNNASSSVKLAKNYGIIIGLLTALEVRIFEETPQSWIKKLPIQITHGKENYSKRKTEIWNYVQSIFPKMKIYKYQADAIALLSIHIGV
jgi:Holliday junction resolvasome RuvABC endonuclease subunit